MNAKPKNGTCAQTAASAQCNNSGEGRTPGRLKPHEQILAKPREEKRAKNGTFYRPGARIVRRYVNGIDQHQDRIVYSVQVKKWWGWVTVWRDSYPVMMSDSGYYVHNSARRVFNNLVNEL